MLKKCSTELPRVHCHTGSLENQLNDLANAEVVHCHTGSLEKSNVVIRDDGCVHCHTGSLEIVT